MAMMKGGSRVRGGEDPDDWPEQDDDEKWNADGEDDDGEDEEDSQR